MLDQISGSNKSEARRRRGSILLDLTEACGKVHKLVAHNARNPPILLQKSFWVAETGVIMLIYLDSAWAERRAAIGATGQSPGKVDLYRAIMVGAVERVRPKMMTVIAIMAGLVPILWSTGAGSEVMQRIAVPMIGGMVSSTLLTLVVIPAIYGVIKSAPLPKVRAEPFASAEGPALAAGE